LLIIGWFAGKLLLPGCDSFIMAGVYTLSGESTMEGVAQIMSQATFDRFIPLNGNVIVRREKPSDKAGEIILIQENEDDRRKKPTVAHVVRTGRPATCEKSGRQIMLRVKQGDRVVIDSYAGHDLEVEETRERYVLLNETDIHCVLGE
jgi:co-chaperonin GroES (HSP10)